jgi:uncharacterized membrane protein
MEMAFENSTRRLRQPGVASRPAVVGVILCAALAIAFAGYVDFAHLRDDELSEQRDIYALWQDGGRILHGENPYARILDDSSGINRKYSTYFPLFYLLSAASQKLIPAYSQFVLFWRVVSFVFYAGIGLILALPFYRRQWTIGATFILLLWLFNRWTLKSLQLVHIDFLAIAPLIASLLLLDRHRRISFLLLGLSLAIKQLAIFIAPLYLIWIWTGQPMGAQDSARSGSRVGNMLAAAFWIALIPAVVSLPFFIWNPPAFVRSIIFSVTRSDEFINPAQSLDDLLDLPRSSGKLMMLALMAFVYAMAYQKRLGRFTAALLVMTVFASFNAIWFSQYEVWPIALLPLVATEGVGRLVEHLASTPDMVQ